MRHNARRIIPVALTLAALFATPALAQTGVDDGQWSVYGGDPGHTRYAALDQIDETARGGHEQVTASPYFAHLGLNKQTNI